MSAGCPLHLLTRQALGRHLDQLPLKLTDDLMKSLRYLALIGLLLCSGTVEAEFFIDNFTILDSPGGGPTSIGSNGITVEASNSGGTLTANDAVNQYNFGTSTPGDSFTIAYDWAGTFDSLQSISGNELTSLPAGFVGNWTTTIDTGLPGGETTFTGLVPTTLATPIALDTATQLSFTFTFIDSPFPFGGAGTFGGISNPLFATPEPTAFFMLGTAGVIVMTRRRRRV